MTIDEALQKVEAGQAGPGEAEFIRQFFALQSVERVFQTIDHGDTDRGDADKRIASVPVGRLKITGACAEYAPMESSVMNAERARDSVEWASDNGQPGKSPLAWRVVQVRAHLNVCDRGYDKLRDGTPWTTDEFIARQAVKLISEAVEALDCVEFNASGDVMLLFQAAHEAKRLADFVFGIEDRCAGAVVDFEAMAGELADSMIPALVGLEALGVDGGQVVMDKSLSDVKRGVRL